MGDSIPYKHKVFTLGPVGYPGLQHINISDVSPIIQKALELPGFADEKDGGTVTTGFARNAVLSVADTVIDAVKQGQIRHFLLVGGCDGAKPGRNYYSELVEKMPDDCIVLNLGCGKFRFFDKDLGNIGGIPRLLDVGQCNDAYSAIKIAVALAEAFGVGVNQLPLSLVLSWYEQKVIAVLLTLLHLGIQNIRIGPTLPAFLTPNVVKLLSEAYNLKLITTPEQDLALGIIAFSEAQANAIQEQIEILGKDNPEFDIFCSDNSPQYFLKALENVQGDERDAIILSVGYGRDSEGKLSLNFGPINKQGGERRLNVAVTRAKSKITLVSSIVAGDIDLSRSNSDGIKLLRDYLEYAASGGERLQGNFYTEKLDFGSPFEEDVYHTLAERGYTIRTQVGCSGYRIDLAVVNKNRPGEFLLGIECDGASYHSSPTARDRDRLRQLVLEKLGWNIHRIWSTDWFRNKPAQVRLLIDKIERLQQNN